MSTIEMRITQSNARKRPLVILGMLWLVFAAVVAAAQLWQTAAITVEWRTETEVNAAGFNVYRATTIDGPFTKVNEQLIPAEGSSTSGASYTFVDAGVQPGATYYYALEDVELDNTVTRHNAVQFTAPAFAWWLPLTLLASIGIGLFLIARGIRPDRQMNTEDAS